MEFLMVLLFPISGLLWALGRATTEAATFEWKNGNKEIGYGMNETNHVYHGWTLLESFGLLLFSIPSAYFAAFNYRNIWKIAFMGIFYAACLFWFYYLPYSLRYNKIRGRAWFPDGKYNVQIFNKKFELRYPCKKTAILGYILAFMLLAVFH